MPSSAPRRLLALLVAAALPLAGCGGAAPSGRDQAAELERATPSDRQQLIYSEAQEAARRFDYQYADAATRVGGEALARGDLLEARSQFEAAIQAWPIFRAAWQGLGETAEQQGDAEAAERARFFLARLDWIEQVHPLAAALAFRNLSEGRTTEEQIATPAYREQAARMVDFLQSADVANVEAANRAQPGETFVQRYGIYVAGMAGVILFVSRFNTVLFGGSDGD